ncbi:PREDICTED: MATH domain and coiled-coil domain-containing protein At2g42480-like [Camelina sativa]|uniref:MATH domain and coiled-coil domain-containing protein At2g42480-like n=1 Tax=Camelina sativa TaxID=90675 RepID=A0ABM0SLJ1_CAMSA|nr:PREDICTED: MATH domain and coiled-coil domain-containing protein At2g42480-like [Camelina sativa]
MLLIGLNKGLNLEEAAPIHKLAFGQGLYSAKFTGKGFRNTFPLKKLQERGFLENDRLIVEVYISRVEIVDGEGRVESENKETLDINGLQVFASRAASARKIFIERPDIAEDFKPKNQVVKTEYMNVLLNLIETLNKPSQNHSESELSNAQSELSELMEQGFKLDWLKSKLDEVYLRRKKSDADVQQLDERVKNLELMNLDFKLDCLKTKLDEVSLERKKSDDADGSRVKEMEARIKNLEILDLDWLKAKLDEVSLKRKSGADDVQRLGERVKNLELVKLDLKLDCLTTKLEEVSLEKKKSDDADGSRVKEMEGRIKDLEMMVSDLKVELGKEKAKSSADDFLLID